MTAGLSSTRPSRLTRPSAIQRSASRREQSPARAISLATRTPRGAAAPVMRSSPSRLDEGREEPEISLADGVFGMPLHADTEPAARVLDALHDAVGRRRIHQEPGPGRLHGLMMRAVHRRLAAA